MEPVDPRMGGLLGGGDGDPGDSGAGPDDLRAIVARAGRRMWLRSAAVAGVVAIAAGGGVGYAVSTTGGSGKQLVATSGGAGRSSESPAAPAGAPASGAPSYAVPGSSKFTRLFARNANGVDVRGYLTGSPDLAPTGAGLCPQFGPRLQAEVSTADMVGVAGSGFVQQAGGAVLSQETSVVGEPENDPVAVVVVQTGAAVAKVRMVFADGKTDEMSPVQGWSALAAPEAGLQATAGQQVTVGTLTAFDSSGRALASEAVSWPSVVPTPLPMQGAGGSGTANSGSAGSGSVSSGGASAGPATSASGGVAYPCQMPPTSVVCSAPASAEGGYACPTIPPAAVTPSKSTSTTAYPATGPGR